MVRSGIVILLALCALTADAQEKEPSLAEAKAAFTKADRTLKEAWAAAKKSLPEEMVAELQRMQRDWLKWRDERAAYDTGYAKAEAKSSPSYFAIAAEMSDERARFLRQLGAQKITTVPGVWDDGFGATVKIVEQEDRILFVLRAPDSATLAGTAAWNESIGWFSDKGRMADKPRETNICFIWRGWKLEILTANDVEYFSRRARVDGTYYKVATLDNEEKAKVIKAAESGEVPEE